MVGSAGYFSGPWEKCGRELDDCIRFLSTNLPTWMGLNKWGYGLFIVNSSYQADQSVRRAARMTSPLTLFLRRRCAQLPCPG